MVRIAIGRPFRWLVLGVLLAALLASPAAQAPPTTAATPLPAPTARAALPPGLFAALLDASAEPFERIVGGYLARSGGLEVTLGPAGISATTDGSAFSLALTGLGRGARARPLAAVSPVLAGDRLEYRRGALVEWYRDTALGLEQGFTLLRRPGGRGELLLELALASGSAAADPPAAAVDADGTGLSFALPGGGLLRYAHLRAWDARGAALPARLEVAGDRLALRIDDRGASYPLTIDPLVYVEVQKVYASGDPGDGFGVAVALDGDTAVVGAAGDDVYGAFDRGAVFVFRRVDERWIPEADLLISAGAQAAGYGSAVALEGDTALVGAYRQTVAGQVGQGTVSVFTRSGAAWSLQATLTATDGLANAGFGYALALSGETALIGAYHDTIAANASQGSAYVFTRSGSLWSQQAKLLASDGALSDTFGCAVALDGDTALVGACFDDVESAADAGSAYVFQRTGAAWAEQAHLHGAEPAAEDRFGGSVALDGDTALVGAFLDDSGGNVDQGTATVFVRDAGLWTRQATLSAAEDAAGAGLGAAVALEGDTAVVGAPFEAGVGAQQGALYIFTRNGAGWSQGARLTAGEPAAFDQFGWAVALSGQRLLVGAPFDDVGAHADQGSAAVFVRDGADWSFEQDLTQWRQIAPRLSIDFGRSVAIDGDTALVGVYWEAVTYDDFIGAAYVFVRSAGVWRQQQRLFDPDGELMDGFGYAVALDGDTALVTSPAATVDGKKEQGSVTVFTRSGGVWNPQQKLVAEEGTADGYFGLSVALDGDTALVGATGLWDVPRMGSALIFARGAPTWTQQARLVPTTPQAGDFYGWSVALDGDTALVGAPGSGLTPTLGAAYVFTRSQSGWTQQAEIGKDNGAVDDMFGWSLALDGDTAIAFGSIGVGLDGWQAAVRVFTRSGAVWTEQAALTPPEGAPPGVFGLAVALQGDVALIGDPGAKIGANVNQGAAYVFVRDGQTWRPQRMLAAADGVEYAMFGRAVALDGDTLLIHAPWDTFANHRYIGSAYFYQGWPARFMPLMLSGGP